MFRFVQVSALAFLALLSVARSLAFLLSCVGFVLVSFLYRYRGDFESND